MSISRETHEHGIAIERSFNAQGEVFIRISTPRSREAASVRKEHGMDWHDDAGTWKEALVNYPAYGSSPVADVLQHVAVLSLACSLAVALDAQYPAGSPFAVAPSGT